jgi:hypothetical protein
MCCGHAHKLRARPGRVIQAGCQKHLDTTPSIEGVVFCAYTAGARCGLTIGGLYGIVKTGEHRVDLLRDRQ